LFLVERIQAVADEALLREVGQALVVVIVTNQNVQQREGQRPDVDAEGKYRMGYGGLER
jgi:hypothetical protein